VRFRGNEYASSRCRKLKSCTECSLSGRQRINLRGWLTEVKISSVESEEDAGQKSQIVKFMCCKIVKQLIVVPPGEDSNKASVKSRTHKLFVALPGNTRQYVGREHGNLNLTYWVKPNEFLRLSFLGSQGTLQSHDFPLPFPLNNNLHKTMSISAPISFVVDTARSDV
jgi:hypothetical protein